VSAVRYEVNLYMLLKGNEVLKVSTYNHQVNVEYCGVFTPCKNYNIETCSRDYTIVLVDEAVYSLCRAEDSRPEPRRAEAGTYRHLRRIASPPVARQPL
jgi:hypothetical protein